MGSRGAAGIEISVLGSAVVRVDGEAVALRPRERCLVAALALSHPQPLDTRTITTLLWPASRPVSAQKAVHNHVLRLRRSTTREIVLTGAGGYRLTPDVGLDVERVEEAMVQVTDAEIAADPAGCAVRLGGVVEEWRGVPFADLPTGGRVDAARHRLIELRHIAEERLAQAELESGDNERAVITLEGLVQVEPGRERRWSLLMVAQCRVGRRRDALETFQEARRSLTACGLDPGNELRRLEQLVLADNVGAVGDLLPPASEARSPRADMAIRPFVGRVQELATLERLLADVESGEPRLVTVVGDPGIGKTTLGGKFAARAAGAGARVIWGTCDPAPSLPLQPFAEAIAELTDTAGPRLAEWLPDDAAPLSLLSPLLAERLPDLNSRSTVDAGRHRLFEAVTRLLAAAASDRPLVLVLDDLHLAAPATRRLIGDCLTRASQLLVVAIGRPASDASPLVSGPALGSDHYLEHLVLTGFSTAEISAYLETVESPLGSDVRRVEELAAGTGGNPLLLQAVLSGSSPGNQLGPVPGSDSTTRVPELARTVIQERLEALAARTREVLRAASVLGTRFEIEDLAAMIPLVADGLADAKRAGILVTRGGPAELRFAHGLLHQVVYDSLPAGTRSELHEMAANAMANRSNSPDRVAIARHHLRAADLDPTRAVVSAKAGARQAMAAFAYEEAAALFAEAFDLESSRRGGDARVLCDLLIGRGDALRRAGDPDNVGLLLEAADRASELGGGELLARAALALCQLGPTSEAGGSDASAAAVAEMALDQVDDPRLRAEVAGAASLVYSMGEDHERCRALFELAEREARASGAHDILAAVLPFAYMSIGQPDDLDRRESIARELVALGVHTGDYATQWEAQHLRFSVLLQRGDPHINDAYGQLVDLTEKLREPTRIWSQTYLAAALAHIRGNLAVAEAEITSTLDFSGAVSPSRVVAVYGAQMLGIRADQGRLGELSPAIASLVEEQPGVPGWRAAMALVAAFEGRPDRVRTEFDVLAGDDFGALPADLTWSGAIFALATAVVQIGDPERTAIVYKKLEPYSGRMSWFGTGSYGPVDQVLSEAASVLGDNNEATRLAASAETMLTGLRR